MDWPSNASYNLDIGAEIRHKKRCMKVLVLLACCCLASNAAVVFRMESFQISGELTLADAFLNGVFTVELAAVASGSVGPGW